MTDQARSAMQALIFVIGTVIVLTILAVVCPAQAPYRLVHPAQATYRHSLTASEYTPLPNRATTPGSIDGALTKAVLCNPKYRTSQDRAVTLLTKRKVCALYGIKDGCPGKAYEIDHLVSIELGGSNDITNLWPQPADSDNVIGFHTKDVVENRAHRAVCDGTMTLRDAQRGIADDWYQFGHAHGWD